MRGRRQAQPFAVGGDKLSPQVVRNGHKEDINQSKAKRKWTIQTATRAETNQSPCGGGDKLSLDTFRNAPKKNGARLKDGAPIQKLIEQLRKGEVR